MNFLAHAHLSGENIEIMVGNFIADSVKGRDFSRFSKHIQTGILLHRKIDIFTDSHPTFKLSLSRIRAEHGKYSGVVVDIFYDHFLAKNWENYHPTDLSDFAANVYLQLSNRISVLPERTQRLLPFLVSQNWLVGYASFPDLERVFYGMDRRTGLTSGMRDAVKTLEQNYQPLQNDFTSYYPELQAFCAEQLNGKLFI